MLQLNAFEMALTEGGQPWLQVLNNSADRTARMRDNLRNGWLQWDLSKASLTSTDNRNLFNQIMMNEREVYAQEKALESHRETLKAQARERAKDRGFQRRENKLNRDFERDKYEDKIAREDAAARLKRHREIFDKEVPELNTSINEGQDTLDVLNRLEGLVSKGTGPWTSRGAWLETITPWGDDETAKRLEQVDMLSGDMILERLGKLKGALSDGEREFIKSISINKDAYTENNKAQIRRTREIVQRAINENAAKLGRYTNSREPQIKMHNVKTEIRRRLGHVGR